MSNTVIQLKYSTVTATPSSLNVGEAAYSFSSDKLFIGNTTNGVLTIGGKYYTDKVDAATHLNTPSTLVQRDSNGNIYANTIYANVDGNITTATRLATPRDIGLAGDATGNVSFDGSSNVTLTVDLSDTGVSPGTYGGSANVPYFTVDAEGRLTAAGNTAISTELSVAGDSGTGSLNLLTETLTVKGGDGITSVYADANATVILDVDSTVIRTTGGQTITGDLAVTGNLFLTGNATYVNVSSLKVEDSLIQLGANNEFSDIVDLGFYGHYSDDAGVTKRHSGLFRDASSADKRYVLFTNLIDIGLDENASTVNIAQTSFAVANLEANLVGGTVSGLSADIAVADGGTGVSTFAAGQLVVGNGTNPLQSLANTGTAGTYANASHVPVITTDAYGRVSSVVNTAIAIDASAITSGTLGVSRGGTGNTSFTSNHLLLGAGTSAITTVGSSTEGHVLQINSSGVPVFAHLSGGTF